MSGTHHIDDIWLASYLVCSGAKLSAISVLPYGSRLTAVFELADVPEAAISAYAEGRPQANVHALRTTLNRLRDAMHRELKKKNGSHSVKEMPNGQRSDGGQRRGGENENRSDRNR